MLDRLMLRGVIWFLGGIRLLLSLDRRAYLVFTLGPVQSLLAAIGRLRAREVFLKARQHCPAYRDFLTAAGKPRGVPWRWSQVPVTSKDSYVKPYSIEARCYGGAIPARGVVIDESSGSSGVPNNWVRSARERREVKRILQLNYDLIYGDRGSMLLNCFALGPWATGMNVSMSLVDVGILKSIGPDAKKLETTLATFGPRYRYLIFGYPPFIKSFVDGVMLNLSRYELDLVVGGEGISENLRAYLSRHFKSVISSYGASDLEINIGVETSLTIALRQACAKEPDLSTALFGRETPPMIFQYNAVDYLIETQADGTLLFTVCRHDSAAPKVRYDLKDVGGVMTYATLERALRQRGIAIANLAARRSRFPILFVYGRADLTVPFFGAKIYPTDLEAVIHGHPVLSKAVRSFQFTSLENAAGDRRLVIELERSELVARSEIPADLRAVFFDGLAGCNQDFREVTRMFNREAIEIHVHDSGMGPFAGADVRVKSRYIGTPPV